MGRLSSAQLRARLAAVEANVGVTGVAWQALAAVVAAWSITEDPEHRRIVGIEVNGVVVERLPGETVEELHQRANPSGGTRSRPRLVRSQERSGE
jgi:hypothetical protein